MNVLELGRLLDVHPTSVRMDAYRTYDSSMTVALELEGAASFTVNLHCRRFSGPIQGKTERISLERCDPGWMLVGEATRVTFLEPLGRRPPPVKAFDGAPITAKDAKAFDEEAMTRNPPQPEDLDSHGVRKPHDEVSLAAYFAAAPATLTVLSYGSDWSALKPREMYTCLRRGRSLDFTALMLQDVSFFSGDLRGKPDALALHRVEGGYEIVGAETRICFRSFSLGKGLPVIASRPRGIRTPAPVMDDELVRRLTVGAPLDDLGLPRFEGRIDLRGAELDDLAAGFNGRGSWTGIDFSGATFTHLMIQNLSVDDCRFDRASLDGLRMWGSQLKNTSFVGASLREGALGTAGDLGINTFENVDFSRAKMGYSGWFVAKVDGCKFDGLKGVQFEGTQFSNCIFSGTISDVSFQKTTNLVDAARFGSNEMKNVDFSNAKFSWVEFRGLDLNEVTWPVDDDLLVVDDYRRSLERSIAWLRARSDEGATRVADWLRAHLDVAGPAQKRGVLGWREIEMLAGGPIDELRAQLLGR